MTPGKGRPKVPNPKSEFVGVRLTPETVQKLDESAEAKRTNRSEIVREGIEKVYEEIKK